MKDLPYEVAPCPNCGIPVWPYSLTCYSCNCVKWVLMLRYREPDGAVCSIEHDSVSYFTIDFDDDGDGDGPRYTIDSESDIPWTLFDPGFRVPDEVVIRVRTGFSRPLYRCPYGERAVTRLGFFYRNMWCPSEEIDAEDFPAHRPALHEVECRLIGDPSGPGAAGSLSPGVISDVESSTRLAPGSVDYESLATGLRKTRKGTSALLIEFMADKSDASV
ncbi:hypothetical protein [Paludisphaera mucosa]|uniref:DUF35 domain-containing protein n=1 Tax=Paludisphaera mucosa TaxID=3030827 RepID=A0ABT6FGB4_9BACT|nr:hypothetical protein [Paludisphaera mucosa]MDG3006612.1 hypothetical protein [Paludisphaera mucosa]